MKNKLNKKILIILSVISILIQMNNVYALTMTGPSSEVNENTAIVTITYAEIDAADYSGATDLEAIKNAVEDAKDDETDPTKYYNLGYYLEIYSQDYELINDHKISETGNTLTEDIYTAFNVDRGVERTINDEYEYTYDYSTYGDTFKVAVLHKEALEDLDNDDSNYSNITVVKDSTTDFEAKEGVNKITVNVKKDTTYTYTEDDAGVKQPTIRYVYTISVTVKNTPFDYAKEKIKISTVEDFINLAKDCQNDVFSTDKYVVLTNDIDLSNTDYKDYCIPFFNGVFDGTFHQITGISIYSKGNNQGLFRYVGTTGVVKNLNVNGEVELEDATSQAGILVGHNYGTVSDCTIYGNIKGWIATGGAVGYNESTGLIEDVINYATVIGEVQTGGVCGVNLGTVSKCVNYGKINGEERNISSNKLTRFTGGIVGYNVNTIKDCSNNGLVGFLFIGESNGGITGVNLGSIYRSYNDSKINGITNIGGIAGTMGKITTEEQGETYNTLKSIYESYFGELPEIDQIKIDYEANTSGQAIIKYSYNLGEINGELNVGGIVGNMLQSSKSEISVSYNEANVTSQYNNCGGIAGYYEVSNGSSMRASINNTYNTGNITSVSGDYTGGIVGNEITGYLKYNFSKGIISGNSYVGGITGNGDEIDECIAYNIIEANGDNYGSITGYANSLNGINGNYFVKNDIGGIDNVSYSNRATAVNIEDFVSVRSLPIRLFLDKSVWVANGKEESFPLLKSFMSKTDDELPDTFEQTIKNDMNYAFNLTFYDEDGNYLSQVRIDAHTALDITKVPEIKIIDGTYAYYDYSNIDVDDISKDSIIHLIRKHYVQSVADVSSNPTIMVVGNFDEGTTLKMVKEEGTYITELEGFNILEHYSYKIFDAENKEIDYDSNDLTIKVKVPSDNCVLALKTENGIKIMDAAELSHHYLITNVESNYDILLLENLEKSIIKPVIIIAAVSVTIIGIFSSTLTKKHMNKKYDLNEEKKEKIKKSKKAKEVKKVEKKAQKAISKENSRLDRRELRIVEKAQEKALQEKEKARSKEKQDN